MIKPQDLIDLRKEMNQTQFQMSFIFGVSLRTYQRMEKGESDIPRDKYTMIKDAHVPGYGFGPYSPLDIIRNHGSVFSGEYRPKDGTPELIIIGIDCRPDGSGCAVAYRPGFEPGIFGSWGVDHNFDGDCSGLSSIQLIEAYAKFRSELWGHDKYTVKLS